MTAASWLSFREFNGLLIYYTHLMSYRCAIREARIGIDTSVPNQVLKMPPCDMKDPSAIPYDAKPYVKLSPSNQFVSVELTYRDGSVSEIRSFRIVWRNIKWTRKPPQNLRFGGGLFPPIAASSAVARRA